MKLLFFPGGPGFNSNPELNLLTERYLAQGIDLIGWHEPSILRPWGDSFHAENAFQNYMDSAERFFLQHYAGEPLTVFGYCYGSHPVRYLLAKHLDKIRGVIIITPDFCQRETDRNIFLHVMNGYKKHNDSRGERLQEILAHYPDIFNEDMEEGFRLAADNPRLFNYYWRDEKLMQSFLQYYSSEYRIDVEGFLAVRRSMYEVELNNCSTKTVVIYGKKDRIISIPHELNKLPKIFSNLEIIEMSEASHYAHIEETDKVLVIIKKEFMYEGIEQEAAI